MLHNIPTGCEKIDRILEGGIPCRAVTLIYGEAETGKTTLSIQCAINCARQGYKTLFIDCDNVFSTQRLHQIASKDFQKISELIMLMRPNDLSEQTTVIDNIPGYLTKGFGLIVVDTLTSLYRAEIAEYPERTFELNRELNREIACLAQIAKTQKIAVIANSQVRGALNSTFVDIEPVANRVLKFWADTIIALRPTEKPQVTKVVLEKTAKRRRPFIYHLKIGQAGMHECLIH
ncbi:AAA family ATPase [Candidatus Bathyarchaeota archaeon]|nr:AAA family ATPase [Candidatus Bathyarchaeota archaeon]